MTEAPEKDAEVDAKLDLSNVVVPEHAAITRRQQFRFKDHKKKAAKAKKEANAKAKEEKKEKKAKKDSVKTKKQKDSNKEADAQEVPTKRARRKSKADSEKPTDAVQPQQVTENEQKGKKPGALKRSSLSKLRKMSTAMKQRSTEANDGEISPDQNGESQQPHPRGKGKGKSKRTVCQSGGSEKTAQSKRKSKKPAKEQEVEHNKKRRAEKPLKEQPKQKVVKEDDGTDVKNKVTKKGKNKDTVQPAINPDYKALVRHTLEECQQSGCTHPTFNVFVPDERVSLSTYWSRMCVGVLVACDSSKTTKKGSKGSGKKQVAYFGCPTSCTYSNLVLAGIFASCLKQFVACVYTCVSI